MRNFSAKKLLGLYKPCGDSVGEENGQVMIIGGSSLFHGAPLLSLKVASRVVDMVFFASPEPTLKSVVSRLKASLSSFIWVPWEDVEDYIKKSDAVLIGSGLMRYAREADSLRLNAESYDKEGEKTRKITKRLLQKFPDKRWVIDAGSLQTMDLEWIPEGAVLTPNIKEFQLLFQNELKNYNTYYYSEKKRESVISELSKKYKCIIVYKGPEAVVCSPDKCRRVKGGNAGLTKGGTGDVLAGLTVALLAKNDPFLAACSASYIIKVTADELYKKVGTNYNADDLAEKTPQAIASYLK